MDNQKPNAPGNAPQKPAAKSVPKAGAPAGSGSAKPNPSGNNGEQKSNKNWKSTTKKAAARTSLTLGKYMGKIFSYALNILLTLLLIGVITGSAIACALAVYIKNYVDPVYDIENLKYDSSLTTTIYYESPKEDGTTEWVEWEEERIHGSENRLWVSYDEMPEDLINAFVSIEDKRFFIHKGVDTRRTIGAVLGFITGNDSYGGSTITQQLIKNVSGEDDVTIQRKIQEILRALNMEKQRDKTEILEMYLNTIYLSKGCYGVAAAANKYFDKDISELSLVECAALAAIPQNPSKYDPVAHPENNLERREIVLNQMYENDYIDKTYTLEEIRAAKEEELQLATTSTIPTTSTVHSWFVDTVINDVVADLQTEYSYDEQTAKNLLYSGGLKIYITIDREIQDAIDAIYQNPDNFPSHGTGVQVESAITVIDQRTGDIVGIVGGRGVKDTPLAFNRATMAKRQPGSSIKPLGVYSIALEKGLINYSTVIDDTPFTYDLEKNSTWPQNFSTKYLGLITVAEAVRQSYNTVAVKVLDMIGTRNSYDFMVNKFHFSTLVESDADYAPLALGGFTHGVTTRDMATAYAAIANGGVYNHSRTYTKVLNSHDNVILDNTQNPEVILSEDTTAVMTRLLQDVVSSGTGTALTLRRQVDVAAKTGTTNDNKDAYLCGYTPYYTAACWVGYDEPKTLLNFKSGQTRISPAIYLWDQVMTAAHQKQIASGSLAHFTDNLTSKLITQTYCLDSGLLVSEACGHDLRGKRTATGYYTAANMPTSQCDKHVDVLYCKDTNCVAGPNCTNTTTVSLVRVNRYLDLSIPVTDAQYTYVDMPEGALYSNNIQHSFYTRTYPPGKFSGYTYMQEGKHPANAFCSVHNPELCG